MSLEALAKVAELCDKYDCVINTAHTIRSYVDSHDLETEALGSTIEATHWLWLGWVYAIKRWFIKGSSYILDHLAPCELKNLPIVPGPCKQYLIARIRVRFGEVLERAYAMIEGASDPKYYQCLALRCELRAEIKCGYMRAGMMLRFAAQTRLSITPGNRPDEVDIESSIAAMQEKWGKTMLIWPELGVGRSLNLWPEKELFGDDIRAHFEDYSSESED